MNKLFQPHITEKSYRLAEAPVPQYTFQVALEVDKEHLKKLIEKEYKVTVVSVTALNQKGEPRRFKGVMGRTKDSRKMVVRLKKGEKLAAFDLPKSQGTNEKESDKQ